MQLLNNKHKAKTESVSLLSNNISKLLNSFQMSEYDLAKSLNIPYNTINRIITGVTTDPRISTLEQIANFFGVKLDFLLNENTVEDSESDSNIPVVSWDYIANPDFLNLINRKQWDKLVPAALLMDDISSIEKTFAIESTKSMQPRFPIGTTFIVKTQEPPVDGDLILVRFKNDNSISLRELIIDSPTWQLKPIISGSSNLLFSHLEHTIIGVVVLSLIQTRAS